MAWVIKIWCKVMELLERLPWAKTSYEVAVVHCWCGGFTGKAIRASYTDLLRLPFWILGDLLRSLVRRLRDKHFEKEAEK